MDRLTLEKYSSSFTLSDMEVYVFPELVYALVLADILSPELWAWKADPWFAGLEKKTFNYRIQRLKQYIMDHYDFNLDLETWGLTTKPRETARFEGLIEPDFLSRSNALFGYEGDKYYFDLDIRRHFGLDKYESDVIPYWKTETVEAMNAFRHKPGRAHGAGECVSLAGLYAAALFVVLGVPLAEIFLMGTPLHSQNFVMREDGFLTNNRRVVTKSMWFNGTALSDKARRALEHERVTVVAHETGHIHIDYPEATIAPAAYAGFRQALQSYLSTPVDFPVFAAFLRVFAAYRRHFQFEYAREGKMGYLPAEVLYKYEHASKYRLGESPTAKVLAEIDSEEFLPVPLAGRHTLNPIEGKLNSRKLRCCDEASHEEFRQMLAGVPDLDALCRDLRAFACTRPRLPEAGKTYRQLPQLGLVPGMDREAIAARLRELRATHPVADLAFYVYREVDGRGWEPFLKTCLERCPVAVATMAALSEDEAHARLQALPNESIYEGPRLATPDEVVNFGRGDGLEKALVMADLLCARGRNAADLRLRCGGGRAQLLDGSRAYAFDTFKNLPWADGERALTIAVPAAPGVRA